MQEMIKPLIKVKGKLNINSDFIMLSTLGKIDWYMPKIASSGMAIL